MSPIQIRPALQTDYPAIEPLLQSCDLPLDGVENQLDHFWVALDDANQLAGVVGVEPYGEFGLLRSVAVAHRNTGLGAKLVNRMIDYAQNAGLKQLILLTTTASDYFPRFGFQTIARLDVPEPVQASVEFQSACPDTAVVMRLCFAGEEKTA